MHNGEELLHILRLVKGMGLTTSLDMALPDPDAPSGRADWVAILSRVLPSVDIFLPSAEEMLYMLDRPRYESYRKASPDDIVSMVGGDNLTVLSDRLLDMGTAVVGIKCGARGFYLRTANLARLQELGRARPSGLQTWPNLELWHPAFSVSNFAGTTGAGDSAIAGFLAGFLRGQPADSCLEYACAVGAFNVTAPDALSGLRSWSETVTAVAGGWQRTVLDVAGAGWVSEANGVWRGPRDTRCAKETRSRHV
jgi:sugar/nucleoside kinase (ribokinase family)